MPEVHSTGRGGAGNIGKDDTVYTDGAIVREGIEGASSTDAEYSTGRGGAGNISDATGAHTAHHAHGEAAKRSDDEYVPEPAFRSDAPHDFHTGRGGAGNEHVAKFGGHSSKHEQEHAGESVIDKAKHLLHLDKKKE